MNEGRYKYGLRVVEAETVNKFPLGFQLKVNPPNPPMCPFGNSQKYVGFDNEAGEYVRFTKSVFKNFLHKLKKQLQSKS